MKKLDKRQVKVYQERFLEELKLISKKGYTRYFLIVADLIKWAKENDIMIGPGRGSVASSCIAYFTDIVTIDAIKYDLIFSRFLNEDRLGMPDIDLDCAQDKRHLVKERLKTLYGENHVAGIPTFLAMKDKMVVRDVARAFDINLVDVNKFCSIIDNSLEDALSTPEGIEFNRKYPEIIKNSLKLNGTSRGTSQHAAGYVISNNDLTNAPNTHLMHGQKEITVSFSKDDAEFVGLLKLDLLGLINLSIVSDCLKNIKTNHDIDIDIDNLNLKDKKVYDSFRGGKTSAIFQLSTKTMAPFAAEANIDNFNDIVATIALVRPGTRDSGLDKEYIARKHGKSWEKKHPVFEKITEKTYGICVYQEQIMRAVSEMADLPFTVAEKIRKVISKKRDAHEFEKYQQMFYDGCKKTGYFNQKEAEIFWEELKAHSNYSFNLAHSVCYSMIGFQTAYLRHYFPLEFFCSNLTFAPKDKKPDLIKEIVKLGLPIITPKIGKSHATKWVSKDSKIFIPFSEIYGIGERTAIAASESSRNNQGFFQISGKQKKSKKLEKILNDINAYDENKKPTEIKFADFDYETIMPWQEKQPNLLSLQKEFRLTENYDDLNSCENIKIDLVERLPKPKNYLRGLGVCKNCKLHENSKPVKPSFGKYNVMIIGEGSHWVDDKRGLPLASDEGTKSLFPLLKKFGLTREMFYITNTVKCVCNKVMKDHVISCNDWLTKEIEYVKPNIVLAFGNTGLKFFTGIDNGIKRMNGITEWNETFDCWICYCVRPLTALFDDTGKEELKTGIRNFVKKVRRLGLKDMEY